MVAPRSPFWFGLCGSYGEISSFFCCSSFMATTRTISTVLEDPLSPRKGVCEPTKKVERFFSEYFRKHPLSREELLEIQRQKKLELARRRSRSLGVVPVRSGHLGLIRTQSEDV